MFLRRFSGFGLFAIWLLASTSGCGKADSKPLSTNQPPAPLPVTHAKLHCLGIQHLLEGTNTSYQAKILQLPEAARLGKKSSLGFPGLPGPLLPG